MAILKAISEEIKGLEVEINRDEVALGRSDGNTLVVPHASVSGRHCSIQRDGRKYTVKDLGSTNGTRLNNRSVQESRLKPNDVIQVGSVEFVFEAAEGDVEIEAPVSRASAQVVRKETGGGKAPESFDSISPFGAEQRKESKGIWFVLLAIIGTLALVGMIYFFMQLLTTG